ASFMTNYRVEIYQLAADNTLTPEQIYSFQQPFVETELDGLTTAVIDASFPPLEAGYRYLLRVQARDPMGNSVFKNSGYSEPVFFDYGSDCTPPGGLFGTVNSFDAAAVSWDFAQGAASYVVRFREKNPNANWYEREAVFNDIDLTDLIENTTYEVQVQSVCSTGGAGPFSPTYEFTTEAIPVDTANFDCTSSVGDLPRPTNTVNIQNLNFGDTVKVAGGFNLRITSATPTSGGGWNGTGQVRVPWLFKNINCRFRNLFINTEAVVYDGNVIAMDEGLSSLPNFKSVADIMAERDTLPLNFCGDSTNTIYTADTVDYSDSFYASGSQSYNDHHLPFSASNPRATINPDLFYNQYNPNNPNRPYSASDYSNSNNPYTPEQPYDAANIWNPWNAFNPYDYTDYTDPANPWTADFPWTADRMFQKQGTLGAADDDLLVTGGVKLPIKLGSSPNMLAIYGIKFTPTGAFLNAYFSADIPMANQHTAFQTIGAGFTPGGLQGEVKLKMLSDVTFSWANTMKLTIQKGNQTYVKFDCSGINEVSVKMEVQVCQDIAMPVDPYTYERDSNSYVTGSFRAVASGWGEFAGELSITPFELTKLPGWAFAVQDAVFDFSETTTPASVSFPKGYDHPDIDAVTRLGRNSPAWRGFYLGAARVRIPDKLTGRDSTAQESLTIGAQGLIIDNTGFTGDIYATNVLSIDTGRLDAWALAIDSVALGIQQNQFHHTNFKGAVKVPVIDQALTYACHLQPGSKYSFEIGLTDTVTMSAFVAKVRLDPNTTIGIDYQVVDKSFAASATLHGQITFGPQLGAANTNDNANNPALGGAAATTGAGAGAGSGPNNNAEPQDTSNSLRLPYITFSDFQLTSRAPYIKNIGSWALGTEGQSAAAGFPLTLNEVGMFQNQEQTEVAFGIDLSLNLVKSDDQGFAANGRAFIICDVAVNEDTKVQEWTFQRVRLDKLSIDYNGPGFSFAGYIQNFENNDVYGTGFQGGIQAGFTPGITVAVAALFGKVDGYRYFFADALLGLDPGIPLGASGMALYGFGGGVSYHMERQSFASIALPYSEADETGGPVDTLIIDNPALGGLEAAFQGGQDPLASVPPLIDLPSEIGQSLSGVRYIPKESVGIGIKAMVAFGAIRREVFNGDITFEIIFNTNGSLNYIGLAGNANFMTPPRTPANPNPKASISFYADLGYNFDAETFDAYLRLQVLAPPVIGYVRGSYPNAVAGTGEIHAGPDD
ncbi:MAG: fibronectin type III domain-containing protein, partial [Bacteroidota bacterium]